MRPLTIHCAQRAHRRVTASSLRPFASEGYRPRCSGLCLQRTTPASVSYPNLCLQRKTDEHKTPDTLHKTLAACGPASSRDVPQRYASKSLPAVGIPLPNHFVTQSPSQRPQSGHHLPALHFLPGRVAAPLTCRSCQGDTIVSTGEVHESGQRGPGMVSSFLH
jgi:hypothetical protein